MKFLTKVTEVYRVGSENEAAALIADAKKDGRFTLSKSSTEYKTVKQKGEIIDEYWLTTLVKQFTDAKDPDCTVDVQYIYDQGVFPEVNDNSDNDTEEDEE